MFTENTKTHSVKEVSKLFGVTEETVTRMIKDGRLDATKEGRKYKITEESMIRLVEGNNK